MPRVRLKNGALRDQIRQDLFDTIIQEPGASFEGTNDFFTDIQGKAAHLTNLRQNQILENQVSFLVQGFGYNAVVHQVANEGLLPTMLNNASYELTVGEKSYWKGPLQYICGNVDQEGDFLAQLGSFDAAKYVLGASEAVAIPPLQSFKATVRVEGLNATEQAFITSDGAGGAERVYHRTRLIGLLRRPVQ